MSPPSRAAGPPTRPATTSSLPLDVLAAGSVAALLYVGFFKGSPLLEDTPVDLTVLCVALVATGVAVHLLGTGGRARLPVAGLLFVAACLPAGFYALTNPEALDKRIRLLIPLIAVIGVCTLVRTGRRQQIWVWLHVLVGVALVGAASVGGVDAAERLAAEGSTTIAAGRASGVAIVVLVLLLVGRGLPSVWAKLLALGVAGWLTVALIQSGSRGPVLACALTVLVVTVLAPGRGRAVRVIGGLGAVAAGWLVLSDATGIGATRISRSLTGEYSLTETRQGLWEGALQTIAHHPLGIGWGNFWAVLPPSARLDSGYSQYPHNVILEVFAEAGWAAGVGAVLILALSLRRLLRSAGDPYGGALSGIAIFFVLNAMVSGDLNDNRMMWAAVAIAWVLAPPSAGLEQSGQGGQQGPVDGRLGAVGEDLDRHGARPGEPGGQPQPAGDGRVPGARPGAAAETVGAGQPAVRSASHHPPREALRQPGQHGVPRSAPELG